ncbi:S-layer homology domain-containing protein [Brachybacterium hainanense]|uniref:S-layer homology domain-containing protein n=1 Tax=Brachybacterium hainanense TaxID=1541174 RepID=A0ABV6R9H8_9MICO
MAVMRRPVPPRIPGTDPTARSRAAEAAAPPAAPRSGTRISRRLAAAGIGAAALLPLGGVVAAALHGSTRAPQPAPRPTSAPRTAEAPTPTPDPPMFSDVGEDHPAREAIEWAAEEGLVPGGEDGIFAPDGAAVRGTLALALHRFAGAPETSLETPVFTDLPDGEEGQALQWTGTRGILWGDADLAVHGERELSRQDLAAALMSAFSGGLVAAGRAVDPASAAAFEDVPADDPATLPLRWASAAGALERSRIASDGTQLVNAMDPAPDVLVPDRAATRAELAVALHAMQELLTG